MSGNPPQAGPRSPEAGPAFPGAVPATPEASPASPGAGSASAKSRPASAEAGRAPSPGRPLRADARRNRLKVLEAARAAFAAEGIAVPLDDIARRAGVGAGTVYRHFPTKEALFEAVVADQLQLLVDDAREALRAGEAGEAFFGFLATMIADARMKKDLAEALAATGTELQATTRQHGRELRAVLGELLARAQQRGAVRDGIDEFDVHAIVMAALAAEQHRADPRPGRLAAMICDGLRPPSG
jgi:AcrR family transcriptional regulator